MNNLHRGVTAAVLAGSAALALGLTTSSQAATSTHTLRFTSHELGSRQLGSNKLVESDKLVRSGSVVGYTASRCAFDFSSHTAACVVSVALQNGTMSIRATVNADDNTLSGRVTGGTGAYRGATGTVSGTPGGRNAEQITVHWQG